MRGIREYASTRKDWLIRLELPGRKTLSFIEQWQPDGILFQSAGLPTDTIKHLASIPSAIHLSESPNHTQLQSVGLNNFEIGEQAAGYLLRRQFKSFAFAGYYETGFSKKRGEAFEAAIEKSETSFRSIDLSVPQTDRQISEWLKSLPKPCGLFATHDECALFLSTLCHAASLRIPEDIAILGCDNDTLICEIAWPQLSSVAVPSREVGREAATRLAHQLAKPNPGKLSKLLSPTGIITRHSTDIHQTPDESVNRALRYMDSRSHTRINIDDVLRETGTSRRHLEKAFAEHVGRSPLKELQRLRIEAAARLLVETDLPLHQIAPRCGCRDATQLGNLFKKVKGITPGIYRISQKR